MFNKVFFISLAIIAVIILPTNYSFAKQKAVVELFTSHGCGYCPPADQLFSTLKNNEDVIALSYHVDYWNRRGFKDPFSRKMFSLRQKDYTKWLGGSLFTPQMIVDGFYEVDRIRQNKLDWAIDKARSDNNKQEISLSLKNGEVFVDLDSSKLNDQSVLMLVFYDDEYKVNVAVGSNKGKKISNVNVVKDIAVLGKISKDKKSYQVKSKYDVTGGCVALVQEVETGKIIAAGVYKGSIAKSI